MELLGCRHILCKKQKGLRGRTGKEAERACALWRLCCGLARGERRRAAHCRGLAGAGAAAA
eukprot:scaffold25363_cov146-Isochrysis_galbana.AAC.1